MAVAKHGGGGTRGWKALQLGIDRLGVIAAQALTAEHVDDAMTRIDLIDAVECDLAGVTGTQPTTWSPSTTSRMRGARESSFLSTEMARVARSRPRSSARDRTVTKVKELGRRRWRKDRATISGRWSLFECRQTPTLDQCGLRDLALMTSRLQ